MPKKFYELKNVTETSADVYLYSEIGDAWFGDSTTAKDFIEELSEIAETAELNIHFNSPGGDVFDGIAIATAIRTRKGTTNAYIDSLAASIASVIACSCDHVYIADRAAIMIHKASAGIYGNANDFERVAQQLTQIDAQIASTYLDYSNTDELQDWLDRMDAETWYYGQDAVDAGLADEIFAAVPMAACINKEIAAKYHFKNVPETLLETEDNTTNATQSQLNDVVLRALNKALKKKKILKKSDEPVNIIDEEQELKEEAPAVADAEEIDEPVENAPKAKLLSFATQNIVVSTERNEDED